MGFDADDRKFRPRQPIRLECEHCQSTGADVKLRDHWYYTHLSAVLCARCWHLWTPRPDAATSIPASP